MTQPVPVRRPRYTEAEKAERRKRFQQYKFTKGVPTRHNCDPADPKEMFLWMMVALPELNGAQFAMPISYFMMVSEHLHSLGVMHTCPECGYAKEPAKKYQAPAAHDPHWLTSPGRWVDPSTPDVEKHAARDVLGEMTLGQKSELFRALRDQLTPQQIKDLLAEGDTENGGAAE